MLSVSSTTLTIDESASTSPCAKGIFDHAVELKVRNLAENDQLTIEHAIGVIAIQNNCSRDRACQLLNKLAFPDNF